MGVSWVVPANPEAAKAFVSSPDLTKEEVDLGLATVKRLLDKASGQRLGINTESKAERGFTNLDLVMASLREYLSANEQKPAASTRNSVTSAFSVASQAANDNKVPEQENSASAVTGSRLHKHLPCSMAHVIRERPIARRPML